MAESGVAGIRTVLAHTLHSNNSSGGLLGFIRPLAEIVGDKLIVIDQANFCPTMKVFITSQYDELEKRFPNHEIFKIDVHLSERASENIDPLLACKYVSGSKQAEPIKPKEYFEVIETALPERNERSIEIERTYPGTRYVFIDDGASFYGPFKWAFSAESNSQIRLEFIDAPLPGVKLAPFQIYKIDRNMIAQQTVSIADGGGKRVILQGLPVFSNSEFHDYASDDEIIRYCAKLAAENNVKLVEKSKIDSLVTYLLKSPKLNVALVKQRLARLPDIVLNVNQAQNEVIESFSDYLSSENGKSIVVNYIEKNQSHFLEMLKREREAELNVLLDQKKEEIRSADSRLKELNESKVTLSVQVEEIRRATKQEAALDTARADADSKLQQAKQELVELEKVIHEKGTIADGLLTLENIHQKIVTTEQNQKYLWKKESDLKNIINDLQNQLGTTEDALRKKLTELKPFVEAINGSFAVSEAVESKIFVKTHDFRPTDTTLVRQRAVISELQRRLIKRGRNLEDWQIANILISTQQSFVSFMAGLPGVGKTSLARLLAEIQEIKPRLKEVSVARGWTSQKDLIGFFNPLTGRFQPSNTGLYGFLKSLSEEKSDNTQAMAYVLLDEANLSPVEHYWSSFMGMTDGESDRELLFGQESLKIGSCLRFIATINYDSTTEPLSPRVVDRSPIILIEPSDFDNSSTDPFSEGVSDPLPISALQMEVLFGNEINAAELENAEKSTFERIKRVLLDPDTTLGRPISISPRKELAIRQYCNKARAVMNAENDFLALDVAISQHILPLVRGNGPRFAKRLEMLRRDLEASSLTRSANFVTRMISFGEIDLQTYDFFCW